LLELPDYLYEFRTEITNIDKDSFSIRGHDVSALIRRGDFQTIVNLLLTGRLLSKDENRLLNAILALLALRELPYATTKYLSFVSASSPLYSTIASGLRGFEPRAERVRNAMISLKRGDLKLRRDISSTFMLDSSGEELADLASILDERYTRSLKKGRSDPYEVIGASLLDMGYNVDTGSSLVYVGSIGGVAPYAIWKKHYKASKAKKEPVFDVLSPLRPWSRYGKLVGEISFSSAVHSLMIGRRAKGDMLDKVLLSLSDEGINSPSTLLGRLSAQARSKSYLECAIHSISEFHPEALSRVMYLYEAAINEGDSIASRIFDRADLKGYMIPGFCETRYDFDPRARGLLEEAEKRRIKGPYIELAMKMNEERIRRKGLRIDLSGIAGAILEEIGLPWFAGDAILAIARSPGICAHAIEEKSHSTCFTHKVRAKYVGPH
jgi:citrate synthase